MKKYLINVAIWYLLLSAGMFIAFILFNVSGFIPVRIILSLILAYIRPFDKFPWKNIG
jgi:hypothetical protein